MSLETAVRYFTEETGILASMSAACGTVNAASAAIAGTLRPDGTSVAMDSVFDLASLTKLFTGLLTMRLHEEGLLDLHAPVTRYVPAMHRLQDVTVDEVLGFEVALITSERLDTQPTAEAARALLMDIMPRENGNGRAYSDMHAMVLKHVLEQAAQAPYMELVRSRILQPLGMENTWCRVPEAVIPRCASYDNEHRIERGQYILRSGVLPGTPHDPKARVLNLRGDDCCGHAGLFSTLPDMIRLCQGVLAERVVSRTSLAAMARNRTGRRLPDGTHTQYLGSQCYVKHPVLFYSEIPLYESDRAIGLSGFTGCHLSIDPAQGVFALFLGNRVQDRLTVMAPGNAEPLIGLQPWPDGEPVYSSVNYVHLKDAHFHNEVAADETIRGQIRP